MNLTEVGVSDVSIDLGSGDVGVAEHSLDRAKVGAVHEEVGGERMSQSMWRDVLGDAGGFGIVVNNALNRTSGETAEIAGGVDGVKVV